MSTTGIKLKTGDLVQSIAGRDKGEFFLVISADEQFVTLCDGRRRRLSNPKNKKINHIETTGLSCRKDELCNNRAIRKTIKSLRQQLPTTLLIIRHGESESNVDGTFTGQINARLSKVGLRQAEATAKCIADKYIVDAAYASDLSRAKNTAQAVARYYGLNVKTTKNLREIYAGRWEGMCFDDIEVRYPEDYELWRTDVGNSKCTDGESVKQLAERVDKAFTRIAEENAGKTVVVATHATPIRATQCLWQTGSLDEMKNTPWVANASFTVAEYLDGKWTLKEIGVNEHLAEFITKLPDNV